MRHILAAALALAALSMAAAAQMVTPAPSGLAANSVGGTTQYANSTLYTATADATIATTGDLSCFGTGVGSQTIPANSVAIGTKLRLSCSGVYTAPAANTATMIVSIKFGAASVASSASVALPVLTNGAIYAEANCTVRSLGAAGSFVCSGNFYTANSAAAGIYWKSVGPAAPTAIDTTAASKVDLTLAWSSVAGGQTATFQQASLQVLN